MNNSWKRARSEDQRQQRIDAICQAAISLNETMPFIDITLANIGREANFTRSNLYKYFSCREDLFLDLLGKELLFWVDEIESTFNQTSYTTKQFSHIWVDILLRHKRMIELFSLTLTTLERNASDQALDKWIVLERDYFVRIQKVFSSIFTTVEREDMDEFLHSQLTLAIGSTPYLFLEKNQVVARDKAGVISSRSYYREVFCHAIESLLSAWV